MDHRTQPPHHHKHQGGVAMTDDTAAEDVTEGREPPSASPAYRHDMTKGAYRATRRLGWVLAAVFAVLLLAVTANLILTLNRTTAACSFYKDLSGLPVTNAAGTNRPSELGVAIIAHSRESFRGSGCGGGLPPPSASFRHWAPFYHLSPE